MKIFQQNSEFELKIEQLLLAGYFHDENLILRDRALKFLPGPSAQSESEQWLPNTIHAIKDVPGIWTYFFWTCPAKFVLSRFILNKCYLGYRLKYTL